MHQRLTILRHANAESSNSTADFDRPLTSAGQGEALRVWQWLAEQQSLPQLIVSSPACRARQTVGARVGPIASTPVALAFDERLYLADLNSLLGIISETPTTTNHLMLVGHNPGLEHLLEFLLPQATNSQDRVLLQTATLAMLDYQQSWTTPSPACAHLVRLIRATELIT